MSIDVDALHTNLERIRQRIAQAAARSGRTPEAVQLVAVTKTVGLDAVRALLDKGVTQLGENRIEVAEAKMGAIKNIRPAASARWHMIGSVQRRKAGRIARLFDCVDAIDRVEVAEALDRACAESDKRLDVLLEVNVSGEASKHGFHPREVPLALERVCTFERLNVQGLMTMAPFFERPEETRPVFAGLRRLAQSAGLRELSMGMSNDFEIAIEEGATQVRVGSILFEGVERLVE